MNGPLLVVATARPELIGRPGGWGEDHATMSTIWLEPLSRAEAERMLAELTGGVPAQVRDAILARAEGTPLFVEELLQSLIDGGVLRREGGRWTVTGPPGRLEVPPTVQAVLAARIDRLPGLRSGRSRPRRSSGARSRSARWASSSGRSRHSGCSSSATSCGVVPRESASTSSSTS